MAVSFSPTPRVRLWFFHIDPGTQDGTEIGISIQHIYETTNQEDRNEDKKKPEKDNPSHGIDPESKEPEREVNQQIGK